MSKNGRIITLSVLSILIVICNVRPVFYLKSNVTLASGDGSISSPYRLQLS